MASLERMKIWGVRSFSHTSPQAIEFFHPLTLILGPNGTGKTTIIECLQYMTTGDMPPCCDHGRAFVHDPQMVNESEVKAQIQLKFRDIQKCEVVTTRSMMVTQKLKKAEFKSLEGTIKRKDKDGKEKSLSSRCSEIDIEMVAAFGVSKPILNNVIFCHQEDSNWPLGESKMLKTKFDQIFAATRYIKGLKYIDDQKRTLEQSAKFMDSDMRLHRQNRETAAKHRKELDKLETRLAASRDAVQSILDKLKPIEDDMARIRKSERHINEVHINLTKKETEFKIEEKAYRDLDCSIVEKFEGSTTDLLLEKSNFGAQLLVKERERDELKINLADLESKIPPMKKQHDKLLTEIGQLKTEADNHKKNIRHRDMLIGNLCRNYGLTDPVMSGQPLTDTQVRLVMEQLKVKIEAKVAEQGVMKESYGAEEKEIQRNINVQNEKKTKLEHTETMRKQEILANRREIGTINADLARTQEAAGRLHRIGEELEAKNRELQTVSGQLDSAVAQREISSLQNEQSTLDREIRQLDAEMMKLMEQVKVQAELDGAQKEKSSKTESIRKLKSKHDDTLRHLLGNVPVEDYRNSLEQFTFQVSQEIRKLTDAQAKMGIELATSESNRKNKMDDLKRKEAELRDSEDLLFQVVGSRSLEVQLRELQESIKNLQDDKGSFAGEKTVYEKFHAKLRQPDPCCPLCHRGFADSQDADELANELSKKLRLMPQDLASKQKLLDEQQRKCDAILELRPVKARVDALRDGEIPALRSAISKLNESIEKVQRSLSENDDMLTLKQSDKAAADGMQSDIGLLDQSLSDLKRIDRRIGEIRQQLGVGGRSLDGVRQEKSDLQAKIDVIQESIKKKQFLLSEYLKKTQTLQADVNRLGAEKVKISTDLQKVSQLEERKACLNRDIEAFQKEIESARVQILPIQKAIAALDKEKEKLLATKERELDAIGRFVNDARNHLKELDGPMQNIERYITENRQNRLTSKQRELETVSANKDQVDVKIKDYNDRLQKLSKDLDTHQARVRNLEDNHRLRSKREKLDQLEEEIDGLKQRLGGFKIATLHEQKNALEQKEQKLTKERHKAQGCQSELEEIIRKLQAELDTPIYRDADKNYTEALVKLTTSKLSSTDLQRYAAALDSAIMQFHSAKMKEINKIIRELWAKTYKGNDMDFIEIQSDVEAVANANSTTGKRKPYNYKVVMVKGNVVQGMRGRCSAGQKVLASLIIRLALAETFCLNCGILALDEPTTNLDRENIDSLAEALSNLVQMRSEHRNFQLLIITHDEEFVERLGRSEYVDYFYRVSKDDRGMSKLSKCTVEGLVS